MEIAQTTELPTTIIGARAVEQSTQRIGREIFQRVRDAGGDGSSRLDRALMDFTMRDERVKAELFHFIDVLPVLDAPGQIAGHLREYLRSVRHHLPPAAAKALDWLPHDGIGGRAVAWLAKLSARRMGRRFIAATDLPEAINAIASLRRRQLAFTIDLLGEAVLSEAEADRYADQYHQLVGGLTTGAANWKSVPLIDRDLSGELPRVNISVKLSSLYSQFDPIDPAGTAEAVCRRLRPILRLARQRGAFINIDMEQYAYKDATLRIFMQVFAETEFRDWADVGIAIQAYTRSCGDDLADLARWARDRGTAVWVRLVKGAYWDYESIIAQQNDWPLPVFARKAETDANYEAQCAFLFAHHDLLRPAIASHNVRSIAHALSLAEASGIPQRGFEFQMLYGMGEEIKNTLVEMRHRVRVYTPFGQLLPGMAYLVRRLLENTSNESFLRAGFAEHVPEEKLLMNPIEILKRRGTGVARHTPFIAKAKGESTDDFVNELLSDFSREEARCAMSDALRDVGGSLGGTFPLIVAGRRMETGKWIESVDPSHKRRAVGRCAAGRNTEALAAIDAASAAFASWRETAVEYRADLLFRSAAIMRRRRFELAAWEVYETGKQWREADADVAEAIDYCEYYGREMLRLSRPRRRDVAGEENEYFYQPRGVAVVIAPWNFPLAILCGMTTAALVTGNTAIMKPAEQSPIIAAKLMEVFEEAGFPAGVVNYLPGIGQEIGPALVSHRDVAIIAFTGSRPVGLSIQRLAAETPEGQDHVKRVITEMGGKNAIIVDDDADLDESIGGTIASAFGYAGQKCSACSRVIVPASIYEAFVQRLVEAARSLRVGAAEYPGNFVGPVIDGEAQQRIRQAIKKAKADCRMAYSAEIGSLAEEGFFVPPTIFADVSPQSFIAQEEIFGPVLAVLKAADLDEALRIANSTRYALTGGFYSRSPAHIERVRREFRVGNLYINRKITGALVDRQPFGGFKLSGVGSKAGGPDYLPQFLEPRAITENTLRRGFAPASEDVPRRMITDGH